MFALGVEAGSILLSSGVSEWSRAALKLLLRHAIKFLKGPIGVGIAIISFGTCMGGWN